MPCLDAAVGEGAQHFELVVVADLLHMGKLRTAEVEGLAVQRQHFEGAGRKIVRSCSIPICSIMLNFADL